MILHPFPFFFCHPFSYLLVWTRDVVCGCPLYSLSNNSNPGNSTNDKSYLNDNLDSYYNLALIALGGGTVLQMASAMGPNEAMLAMVCYACVGVTTIYHSIIVNYNLITIRDSHAKREAATKR